MRKNEVIDLNQDIMSMVSSHDNGISKAKTKTIRAEVEKLLEGIHNVEDYGNDAEDMDSIAVINIVEDNCFDILEILNKGLSLHPAGLNDNQINTIREILEMNKLYLTQY